MRSVQKFASLCIIVLALGLMGQAQECSDLKSLMPKIDEIFGAKKGSKLYISNLSFMDADTKDTMAVGDGELINQAVEKGMNLLASQDPGTW